MTKDLGFELNGVAVSIGATGDTLLGVLRGELGCRSLKDGCSPQGQCGCCTVLVDGAARVACVTPARRVVGRSVTTVEGLKPERQQRWADAFVGTGASQCGFCTPGIVLRLEALSAKVGGDASPDAVNQALLAHLCRCTGWQTIVEAYDRFHATSVGGPKRDMKAAAERAGVEGRNAQVVGKDVVLGSAGFAADTAPEDALIAVYAHDEDDWVVGETLAEARQAAGKVQGRRTTAETSWPIEVPEGDWDLTLQTTWVEPAYLETDASWAFPGRQGSSPLANGGAFGAKVDSLVPSVAERLASEQGRPVLVMASREDTVRFGPKRPPVAIGVNRDGTGVLRVAATDGIEQKIRTAAPGLQVETIDVVGPRTSARIRGAGWVEALVAVATASGEAARWFDAPDGGSAQVEIVGEIVQVFVRCGRIVDPVVLRSYCIGAVHMAWSWVASEALVVDSSGAVHDLTVRSFGVMRAVDMPLVKVTMIDEDGPAVNGSDAVFAAAAAAVWRHLGLPARWPTGV